MKVLVKIKGQVAVEYVLLLLVAVVVCVTFLSFFKAGGTDTDGAALIELYRSLIRQIATDLSH